MSDLGFASSSGFEPGCFFTESLPNKESYLAHVANGLLSYSRMIIRSKHAIHSDHLHSKYIHPVKFVSAYL